MKTEIQNYKEITKILDKRISKSFCLAKWYHANIYFQTGETHSCYHPPPHAIDLNQIKLNPSAIHNTTEKIEERNLMLKGMRPKGCQYCWNIEDLGKDLISDRHIRSGSLYNEERLVELEKNKPDFNVTPNYIEVSFSNLCNFKCGYCHPKASSKFFSEIKLHGPYPNVQNHRCDIDWFTIYEEENNPFLEAWWRWWPDLSTKLDILRITGGEPLLQKSTFKVFDFLIHNKCPNLELNVNSNMGMSTDKVATFISKINQLIHTKSINKFKLFTSIDTWGPQAEYVRTGLDLNVFEKNILLFLKQTSFPITLMITFNIFSIFNFKSLLEKILSWRKEFFNSNTHYTSFHRIRFDLSYLKEPLIFDINILPKEKFLPYLESALVYMKENVDDCSKEKFSFIEYQRFLRVFEYMKITYYPDEKITEGRKDFYNFFTEYDKRRNLKLLQTFPELQQFFECCHLSSKASSST